MLSYVILCTTFQRKLSELCRKLIGKPSESCRKVIGKESETIARSLESIDLSGSMITKDLAFEEMMGIEPTFRPWQGRVIAIILHLHYANYSGNVLTIHPFFY